MRNSALALIVVFLVLSPCLESHADDNTFNSPTIGFSVTKPDGWQFLSAETLTEAKSRSRLNDEQLQELVRENARKNPPIVAIAKYPEPIDKVNPGVQVSFKPMGQMAGMEPSQLMEMTLPVMQKAYSDFAIVEGVDETTVCGHDAAYMKANYTAYNTEGVSFRLTTRIWYVVRGDFIFMIGMSGPQDGEDVSDEEFKAIYDSISIEE